MLRKNYDFSESVKNPYAKAVSDIQHTVSSGNVYEDLGYENSTEMKIKAEAVRTLAKTIADSGMTQSEAAKVLGIDQPKISRILRGQFRGLSLEKIMGYILALGSDIEIMVREKQNDGSTGHFRMAASS